MHEGCEVALAVANQQAEKAYAAFSLRFNPGPVFSSMTAVMMHALHIRDTL